MIKVVIFALLLLSSWVLFTSFIYRYMLSKSKSHIKLLDRIDYFDVLIKKADTYHVLKHYNSVMHIIISIITLLIGYFYSGNYLGAFPTIVTALMSGVLPTIFLKIYQTVNEHRARKEAMNFYGTFSNYCAVGHDIFTAFRSSIPEIAEPYKTVITKMIKQYDSRVDPITCLKTASEELGSVELNSFFKTLIFQYIEGGDVVRLANDYIKDLGKLIELDEKENTEDRVLNLGIYLLVGAQLFILGVFLKSNMSYLITGTVYGEVALTVNLVLSLLMVLMTFIKPRRA